MNTFYICLRLLSPMQIGAGALGMIEKSLLYIPDRVIWGAFTNTLTQILYGTPAADDYVNVGKAVESGRISTFFPELDGIRYIPVIPDRCWISEKDENRSISFAEMESLLLTSVTSTAIDPSLMAAGMGTLHATDLINHRCRRMEDDKVSPVYFSGYMELPGKIGDMVIDSDMIKKVFSCSRLGGSRKRGWGMVAVEEIRVEKYENFSSLSCLGGKLLTADLGFDAAVEQKVCGDIRLVSRREYDAEKGSGKKFASAKLFWSTGSMIYE